MRSLSLYLTINGFVVEDEGFKISPEYYSRPV